MFISEAFTTNGTIAALLGGVGIGLACVTRAASTGSLLPSSTYTTFGTPAMLLTAAALSKSYGTPVSRFFELQGSASLVRVAVGGALVGAGSKMGRGCTSGNGIQGLAAMSPASLVFVLTFMTAGAIASAFTGASNAVIGSGAASPASVRRAVAYELFGLACALAGAQYIAGKQGSKEGVAVFGGASFATSLVLSTMPKPSRVLGFLDFTNPERGWDPTLAFVMGGALLVAVPSYMALGLASPHKKNSGIYKWASRPIDSKLILGGVLFGCGWGCSGMCPGPGIVSTGAALASDPMSVLAAGGLWTASMFGTKQLMNQAETRSKKA